MEIKRTFMDLLRERKEQEEEIDLEAFKDEWLTELRERMAQFKSWLEADREEGLYTITELEVDIDEERLGKYKAPGLLLKTPGGRTIEIEPKARVIVGGLGRIDFSSVPNRFRLIQTEPGKWAFALVPTVGHNEPYSELGEESFFEHLYRLIA